MDTDNFIRIYSTDNMKYLQSYINAEYIIESQLQGTVIYGGESLYWMLKEKKDSNGGITLYRHPDYSEISL